ncbi:MAG: Uma2 family endonuclease [Blastocatellia bacterium]|nr:Uma2 family endonuclease [Blastocatellia bacterium]
MRVRASAGPVALRLHSSGFATDEEFAELCRTNPDLSIEQNANGEIELMPPTGGETGNRNSLLIILLGTWALADGTGKTFDSSTLFKLPNGAKRSPDAAWVQQKRINALTDAECLGPLPLCPDFAIELCSPTDDVRALQDKMQEYTENGLALGWLIDPDRKQVHIYRSGQTVECLENPEKLSGESVLPGFELDLARVLAPLKDRIEN